jgi:anaerobic selenocysteine-containing dehydrogenase
MYHSEQRQWPTARHSCPDPLVSVHPDVAREIGAVEGDWVVVTTPRGSIRQRLCITGVVPPRVADSQHGWWFPERRCDPDDPYGMLESNANQLVSDATEDCSSGTGAWAQTGLPCRIVLESKAMIQAPSSR